MLNCHFTLSHFSTLQIFVSMKNQIKQFLLYEYLNVHELKNDFCDMFYSYRQLFYSAKYKKDPH